MSNKLKYTLLMLLSATIVVIAVIPKHKSNEMPIPIRAQSPIIIQEEAEVDEAIRISREEEQTRQAQERLEREQIKKEQNEAYQRSLAADQEKERARTAQEEERIRLAQEEERIRLAQEEERKRKAQEESAAKQAAEDEANRLTSEQTRKKRLVFYARMKP